jgi:UDP-N-acetylglucosamine--N-acetylmuramyl-(pentapeptide) pyrophosphoryl-undecaprenol N-acetylglucosamine transferase
VLAARFARYIAISFEEVREYFPKSKGEIVFTGIPMRDELMAQPRPDAFDALGIDANLPVLLVLGGSQGAERINELMLKALKTLLPWCTVIHQTGKSHFELTVLSARELITDNTLLERYRPVPFFDDATMLNDAYHLATLIISRAGSTSIYEIAQHGKPSILIPISEIVSHDQRSNAYAYARAGAALVLEENNVSVNLLTSEIDRIMKNPVVLTEMSLKAQAFAPQNGGNAVAKMALMIAEEHR